MLVNRRTVRIEFGDCDPAGIVWYPRYFGFFDGATAGLFEAAGWKKSELPKAFGCIGFPMVDTRAKFHIPSRYCEDIIIESRVAEWRRSSFDVEHKVFKPTPEGGEALAIEAWETRVWVGAHPDNPGAIKSRPVPQEIIDRFQHG